MCSNYEVTLLFVLIGLPCRFYVICQKNDNCWEGIQSYLLKMLGQQTTTVGVSGIYFIDYLSLSWDASLPLDLCSNIPVLMTTL